MSLTNDVLLVEHPITERMRHVLRVAHAGACWHEALHATPRHDAWVLMAWQHLVGLLRRGDIKGDALHEMEHAQTYLKHLSAHHNVDHKRLKQHQDLVRQHTETLKKWRASQDLPKHEWLDQMWTKQIVPAHTPGCDMPSLGCFLNAPTHQRTALFQSWEACVADLLAAVSCIVHLMRNSHPWQETVVSQGVFTHPWDKKNAIPSLVRVAVPQTTSVYPEISTTLRCLQIRLYQMDARHLTSSPCMDPTPVQWSVCAF